MPIRDDFAMVLCPSMPTPRHRPRPSGLGVRSAPGTVSGARRDGWLSKRRKDSNVSHRNVSLCAAARWQAINLHLFRLSVAGLSSCLPFVSRCASRGTHEAVAVVVARDGFNGWSLVKINFFFCVKCGMPDSPPPFTVKYLWYGGRMDDGFTCKRAAGNFSHLRKKGTSCFWRLTLPW